MIYNPQLCIRNIQYKRYKRKLLSSVTLSLFLAGILVACEKNPDLSRLDNDNRVVTNYEETADFRSFSTYFLPDSILLIGQNKRVQYLDSLQAAPLLDAYCRNLQQRGYIRTTEKESADMGLQLTYIADTRHFIGYVSTPFWWWGFPGYWSTFYWGNWGSWYYPFPVHFSFSTGSLLMDLIVLKAEKGEDKKLPVIWHNYITGLLDDSISEGYFYYMKRKLSEHTEYLAALFTLKKSGYYNDSLCLHGEM